MIVNVVCTEMIVQKVTEDKIDAETGSIIFDRNGVAVQKELSDRHRVEFSGAGLVLRLDGNFEEIYEQGKTYSVEIK